MDSNRRRRLRVLLADDHQILRDGLRSLLEDHPDIEVVADTGEGREAVRLAGELKPDVAIMDIGMPELNGIDATREIVVSGAGTKVVCLSVHREGNLVKAMMDAGASGYRP
jgi:DNA-binding NarL/FixJ family response regulator